MCMYIDIVFGLSALYFCKRGVYKAQTECFIFIINVHIHNVQCIKVKFCALYFYK
jgi:hypothetical protein